MGYLDGEATNLGQEDILVRFASDSVTCVFHRIATVPEQLIKVCSPAVADVARQTLNLTHTSGDILSSSDALPAVDGSARSPPAAPSPTASACSDERGEREGGRAFPGHPIDGLLSNPPDRGPDESRSAKMKSHA